MNAIVPVGASAEQHAAEIRALYGRVRTDVVEIGRRLAYCHEEVVPHGDWAPWLKAEFGWTTRHALGFMNVYHAAQDPNRKSISDLRLPVTAICLLANPSTPPAAVDEIVESAKDTALTVSDVKKVISKHKPKAKPPIHGTVDAPSAPHTPPPALVAPPATDDPHAERRLLNEMLAEESLVDHWRRCSDELGDLLDEVGVERLFKAMSKEFRAALRTRLEAPGKPYKRTLNLSAANSSQEDQPSRQ
jgi:hypothetical protein